DPPRLEIGHDGERGRTGAHVQEVLHQGYGVENGQILEPGDVRQAVLVQVQVFQVAQTQDGCKIGNPVARKVQRIELSEAANEIQIGQGTGTCVERHQIGQAAQHRGIGERIPDYV